MTQQMSLWLARRGPALELCAVIPSTDQQIDVRKSRFTRYASPGSFLSRIDTSFDEDEVVRIKGAVLRAMGTLDQVFTIDEINLSPEKLRRLGLTTIN